MDSHEISLELDDLVLLQTQLEALNQDEAREIQDVIPPEVRAAMDAVYRKHATAKQNLLLQIHQKEALIQEQVLQLGRSVEGKFRKALYMKGKFTWDGEKLMNYAKTHYQILAFRKQGRPLVRIVPVRLPASRKKRS